MSEHFCYIAVHKTHINLGFNYGSELPDPERLLQGPGKLLRHVQITTPEDLAVPALRRLLEVATTRPPTGCRCDRPPEHDRDPERAGRAGLPHAAPPGLERRSSPDAATWLLRGLHPSPAGGLCHLAAWL
jgi:hypothetical protein